MKEKRFKDRNYANFVFDLGSMVSRIEERLGEPYNPDEMLIEGQELLVLLEETNSAARSAYLVVFPIDHKEDHIFEDLVAAMSKAKKFVDIFAGREWWLALDFPAKMPRSREKVRETARAILSAWDDNSADPELARVIPMMDELRAAFDSFVVSWDAQQDAIRVRKDKYRTARKVRVKCNRYVGRVKKYLSIYLDPYSSKWGLYGFEEREKKE